MTFKLKTALLCSAFLFLAQTVTAGPAWQALNAGLQDADIRSISVFSQNNNLICASSSKQVYFSENAGELWQKIFLVGSKDNEINFLTFDSRDAEVIYLATDQGLFATKDQGKSWQKIFQKINTEDNQVNWITLERSNAQRIYLGTNEGLYVSSDQGKNWQGFANRLERAKVTAISVDPDNSSVIYLANSLGLFKSIDSGKTWKRTFVTSYKLSDEEIDDEESEQEQEPQNLINCIAIDQNDAKRIYLATTSGVFFSSDAGEVWSKLPASGLTDDHINFILVGQGGISALYAATQEGVFTFLPDLNNWSKIYQGMTASNIRCLALNKNKDELFAGTDAGFFQTTDLRSFEPKAQEILASKIEASEEEKILQRICSQEPTIRQVQEAALKYAEVVHPQSIKNLRRNARIKTLLPDVSLAYDKTVTYDSGVDKYYVGPYDWGFTFSWDLGDLIFNEQVRLIDSNTRLAVQLRDDILDEVTRLYYERLKLKASLILAPAKSTQDKLMQNLRLEELTASIDGLTGGYFSRNIKNNP